MLKKMLRYFMLPLLLLLSNSSGNSAPQGVESDPAGFNAGPDIIAGNMADLYVDGVTGTQNGLAIGVTSCDAGNQVVNFFAMPNTNHPAIAQNLYRMSGGATNNDRFEQIGQAWVKHTYGAEQANACNFGCQPGGDFNHLGVGCSDTYFAFQSAQQGDLGSRAWINPFTGVFQSNARDHTGHIHTAVSHMMVVERNDLDTTMNPGATYYAELLYVTPDEYAWCQVHSGECNMSNNASYRPYSVTGTTSFTFSAAGSTVPMTPAINAWTGATINPIEPQPGVDGRAFIAWKVTGPVAGVWHYEYALYNQNLDRAIQSFSLPLGCGVTVNNLGFHAPPNHPGFPNDGTLGDAGFSNAVWTSNQTSSDLSWTSETFTQNQNANAIRWGTLYNFRFDSNHPPQAANATIGFFKTGTPITVGIQGPSCNGTPTPTATATPTVTPSTTPTPTTPPTPTPTTTPNPTPTPTPIPTPTPAAQALNLSTRMRVETGDSVGIGGFIITGTGPKHVLLRAIGPSLTQFGVPNVLADPVMELHGPGGFVTITDDNWRDDPVQEAAILADGIPPTNDLESAIDANLNPGAYTAVVRGNNNTSGVSLVEVYDLDQAALSKLGNISTRAFVSTGDNIVIAGFILGNGASNDTIVVRGLSLNEDFDPTLELRDADGNLIGDDNDWQDDPAQAAELIALGLAPPNTLDAAIVATFPPGLYTALLAGRNGGTGIGLVEVYDNVVIGPTPSPTPAGTPTPTPSAAPTVTPSATPTATPTGTPSPTPTPTPTPTPSSTLTPSATPTSTVTPTPSEGSPTATATATATASPTPSTPTPTPTPTPCPFTVFPENFDGVTAPALPPCWTTDGTGNGILWVTSTGTPDTTPNCAFIDDQDGISDKSLYSPGVAVCSPSAQLSFRNYFNTEFSDGTYWDGGVLEVSSPNINAGVFTDITDPAVGGSFVAGGYTGVISDIAENPLAGRMAWSGDSGGYIDTVVNLGPNVTGQTIQLRFRMGTDEAMAAPGWRIDTMTMVGGGPCPTPTPIPTSTPSPPGALWYNGDFDGINALANEQDTFLGSGQFARVYDNFNVTGPGWNVTEVFSHNLENTNVTGATWEIRRGRTLLNTGGTLVGSGTTAAPIVTQVYCGFGFCEFEIKVTGLNLFLPALPEGQFYWLNVTPIGDFTGRSFNSDTTGANCIGTPCGNDGNAFFNSNFFGVTWGSTADQDQPGDFSMGVHGTVFGAPTPTPTPAFRPTPTPTPTPSPSATPTDTIWYNGDWDGLAELANERDVALGSGIFASVYDNFNVTGGGWNVTAVFSYNIGDTVVRGATWEIRSGTTLLHTGGTLVASGMTSVPIVTFIGPCRQYGCVFRIKVAGLNVFLPVLPAGQFYWLNVTPIGNLTGFSYDTTTSGANCVGTPCGNDQNAFFNSNYFDATFADTADFDLHTDFSMGINGTEIGAPTPTPTP